MTIAIVTSVLYFLPAVTLRLILFFVDNMQLWLLLIVGNFAALATHTLKISTRITVVRTICAIISFDGIPLAAIVPDGC